MDQHANETTRNGGAATAPRPTLTPRCDVRETEREFVLVADVPGADESTLELSLEAGTLSLRAPVAPRSLPGATLAAAEYEAGDWARSFAIGAEIDPERVEARLQAGVLRVTLPKRVRAKAVIAVRHD